MTVVLVALLLVGASLLAGSALSQAVGDNSPLGLRAAVGLGALVIASRLTIRLPGHAVTASVVIVVALIACCFVVVRGRQGRTRPTRPGIELAAGVVAFLAALVPFWVANRVGLLGVTVNNDTQIHLLIIERLRDPASVAFALPSGYPLGPHSLVAVVCTLTGISADSALTGLMVTVPIVTAMTAASALKGEAGGWAVIGGALVAVAYLLSAYYVQSSFKETLQALFVLTFALYLVPGLPGLLERGRAVAVPLGILVAASLYTYSYPGLIWFGGIGAVWLLAECVRGWVSGRLVLRSAWRRLAILVGIAVGTALVLAAPEASSLVHFFRDVGVDVTGSSSGGTALGNLAGPLPFWEGLGLWTSADWRYPPHDLLAAGIGVGIVVVCVVAGIVHALRRGRLALPVAVVVASLVWVYSDRSQSPYVAAKALVVLTPIATITALGYLLARSEPGRVLRLMLAGALVFVGGWSSFLALRSGQVWPAEHRDDLRALQPFLSHSPTLFLASDDYATWELRGTPIDQPNSSTTGPVPFSPAKGWKYGEPYDFDLIPPKVLDRYRYVVTTRTPFQSTPPANFRLVHTSTFYEVWERHGPTPARRILAEEGVPGANLDCRTPRGRRLARRNGFALVRPAPQGSSPIPALPSNGSATVELRLPQAGDWVLSLPYTAPQHLLITAPGFSAKVPANLDRIGSFWPVGTLHAPSGGTYHLSLTLANEGRFRSDAHVAFFNPLTAILPGPARRVPLRAACGLYVDSYTVTRPGR